MGVCLLLAYQGSCGNRVILRRRLTQTSRCPSMWPHAVEAFRPHEPPCSLKSSIGMPASADILVPVSTIVRWSRVG